MADDLAKLRQRRLLLQKEIADAHAASTAAWATYVRPNTAGAKMLSGAPMSKTKGGLNASGIKVLPMKEAELQDRSTATGAFEYGRSVMEHWGAIIRSKRSQLEKVEEALAKIRSEAERARDPFSDAIGRAWGDGSGGPAPAGGDARDLQDDLPGHAAQRLVRLRGLVHDARGGDAGV